MSESVNPLAGQEAAEAGAVEAQVAENAAKPGTANASTMVPNNVGALQREAPEVFRAIMEGIAMTVIGRMRRSSERIRNEMRKAQNRRY